MQRTSFAPVGSNNPKILILGSMPGEASLAAGQYYAHPRNAFWPIMGELFGARPGLPYEERLAVLARRHIALWESLQSCVRAGSLDSAITDEVPNDFNRYFHAHPGVSRVFFNGAKAESSFKKHVLPRLKKSVILQKLPSTSPAHAGMRLQEKLEHWRVLKGVLQN